MDSDQIYWLSIVKMVGICIVLIVFSISGCTMHQDRRISESIKNGADPISARIAYSGSTEAVMVAEILSIKANKTNQQGEE